MQFNHFHFDVSSRGRGPRLQSVSLLVFDMQMGRLFKKVKCKKLFKQDRISVAPVENSQKLPGSFYCLMTMMLSSRGDLTEKYSQFAKRCHYS